MSWPVKYPYWVTGETEDRSVIVSYADCQQYIYENWPEAEKLDVTEVDKYEFTDRFPKPEWFREEGAP